MKLMTVLGGGCGFSWETSFISQVGRVGLLVTGTSPAPLLIFKEYLKI